MFFQWFSILPAEYQESFYGIPWPVLFFTSLAGFFLILIISWQVNSNKSRQKRESQESELNELKAQIKSIVDEKLLKERELVDTQNEVSLIVFLYFILYLETFKHCLKKLLNYKFDIFKALCF